MVLLIGHQGHDNADIAVIFLGFVE